MTFCKMLLPTPVSPTSKMCYPTKLSTWQTARFQMWRILWGNSWGIKWTVLQSINSLCTHCTYMEL